MKLPKTPSFPPRWQTRPGRRRVIRHRARCRGGSTRGSRRPCGNGGAWRASGFERRGCSDDIEAGHSPPKPLVMDIADIGAMREKLAPFGAFDVLVNSAGIARHSPALETDPSGLRRGHGRERQRCTLPRRGRRPWHDRCRASPGSIITISSQMGHVGGVERARSMRRPNTRVEGMTKSMAIEWGRTRDSGQHHLPDLHSNAADGADLRAPGTRPLDRGENQARPGRRGRGHHGCGRVSGVRCLGAGDRHVAVGGWRLDSGLMSKRASVTSIEVAKEGWCQPVRRLPRVHPRRQCLARRPRPRRSRRRPMSSAIARISSPAP